MARKRPKGKPSLGGAGRHVQQYRVSGECVDKKLAVINHLKQCKEMRKTITHYFPNLDSRSYNSKRTTILRWVRERKQLEAAVAQGKGGHKKLRNVGTGTIMSAESEAYLAQWVNELRDEGIPVSTKMLTDKALKRYAASINVVLLKVPSHATPVSQPADVAWNFPLKARLRQYWHDDMKAQIRQGRNSSTKLKLKRPSRTTICNWVLQAWGELSTETISSGFRASGLLPSDNCVASAELVADLEKLHLLEGDPVKMSHDFLLSDIVEEAVV